MSVITDKNGNVIEEIARDGADNETKAQEIAPESDREHEKARELPVRSQESAA
jgi:hypothetical protein